MYDILTDDKKHLELFKKRFEDVKSCKDKKIKEYRLGAMLTDMENAFDIPQQGVMRKEAFKLAFPDIMDLYTAVAFERWH